ncbi:hypothetical protein C2H98_10925 [Niallia circulans]|nr:hypothetical protein C2H98_10925 [Niallia circulans]
MKLYGNCYENKTTFSFIVVLSSICITLEGVAIDGVKNRNAPEKRAGNILMNSFNQLKVSLSIFFLQLFIALFNFSEVLKVVQLVL